MIETEPVHRIARLAGVILLSDCAGSRVTDEHDQAVGTLADVTATLDESTPIVNGLVVRVHHRQVVVPFSEVLRFERHHVQIRELPIHERPSSESLWLRRDVYDGQVVDLRHHRLVRVGDVEFGRSAEGLRVTAVHLGLTAVMHRLGLLLPHTAKVDRLPWGDLHLATPRGHRLQLRSPASAVHGLCAEELERLAARLPRHRADEIRDCIVELRAGRLTA
ncbi:MAG: hypothetical protein QOF76_5001 [Solirubrobacteraceae bacterium]|nr:hypothetical protein [Solirubrobacteraceae bacterium]